MWVKVGLIDDFEEEERNAPDDAGSSITNGNFIIFLMVHQPKMSIELVFTEMVTEMITLVTNEIIEYLK